MAEAVPFRLTLEYTILICALVFSQIAFLCWLITNTSMQGWKDFLDSLDSDGGKILLLELAAIFGAALIIIKIEEGKIFFGAATGALLAVLKMTGSNAARKEEISQVQAARLENPPGEEIAAPPPKVG